MGGCPGSAGSGTSGSVLHSQCSPPLTEAEVKELTGIVMHTEKCAVFMHEVECSMPARSTSPHRPRPSSTFLPDEQGAFRL